MEVSIRQLQLRANDYIASTCTITRYKKPVAMILPIGEYERLLDNDRIVSKLEERGVDIDEI